MEQALWYVTQNVARPTSINILSGDIVYLSALGRPIVVLSSEEVARDLLDKRGTNYSDRPNLSILKAWARMTARLDKGTDV